MRFTRACATLKKTSSDPAPGQAAALELRPAAWALPLPCGILRHPVSVGPTSAMNGCYAQATFAVMKQKNASRHRDAAFKLRSKDWKRKGDQTRQRQAAQRYACCNLAQHTHARCRQRQAMLRRRQRISGSTAFGPTPPVSFVSQVLPRRWSNREVMTGNSMGTNRLPIPRLVTGRRSLSQLTSQTCGGSATLIKHPHGMWAGEWKRQRRQRALRALRAAESEGASGSCLHHPHSLMNEAQEMS